MADLVRVVMGGPVDSWWRRGRHIMLGDRIFEIRGISRDRRRISLRELERR